MQNTYEYPDTFLCRELNLEPPGPFCQDWEIMSSDYKRTNEFVKFYINNSLNDSIKESLFMIILCSFDETLMMDCFDLTLWKEFSNVIISEYKLHEERLIYWASYPEDDEEDIIEDCFYLTPYIREIIEKCKNNVIK